MRVKCLAQDHNTIPGAGRRRYSQKNRVGVCGPLPKTLTLFMTKICDFSYPIYDLTKNLIPYNDLTTVLLCISLYSSDYLLVASVYSVEYSKSMSGQLQFKNPGGPAHDRNA